MLKLAEIFCLYDFHVTFLNTDYIHSRLITHSDVEHRFKRYKNKFRFATVPDGLPEDNPRTGDQLLMLLESMEIFSKPLFEEIVKSGGFGERKLSCVIADGAFSYAVDVAVEAKVPILYFDTLSPCGLWSILSVGKLIEAGEIPFQDDDMDAPIKGIPGMESFLRRRDLPSFFRVNNLHDPIIQRALKEEPQIRKSNGLIFNSFENLEAPILSHLRTLVPKLYAIGPLHLHLKTRLSGSTSPSTHQDSSSNSIWEEDVRCMTWLNQQPLKSVVYVSIGSLAVMTKDQLIEIWYGLINCNFKFLWVQRPGSINYEFQEIPDELIQGTKERGFIVKWAPQELVLAHPSIGGFLTHSGWNSTVESIVEEVPMICWPYYADQQVNSRFVGEVWKIGLDMKDRCDRDCFEKMIREVMEERKDEFLGNVGRIGKLAKLSVGKNGSSYNDLNRLIEDIRLGHFKVSS